MQETEEDDPGCSLGQEKPGGGHGNTLQYSCLENPMDRGAWQATVHSVANSKAEATAHTCCCVIFLYIYAAFL